MGADRQDWYTTRRGSAHTNSKLTEERVRHIKWRILEGDTNKDIAADEDVSTTIISRIRRGKAWTHVKHVF